MLNSYGGSRCTVSDGTSERGSIARRCGRRCCPGARSRVLRVTSAKLPISSASWICAPFRTALRTASAERQPTSSTVRRRTAHLAHLAAGVQGQQSLSAVMRSCSSGNSGRGNRSAIPGARPWWLRRSRPRWRASACGPVPGVTCWGRRAGGRRRRGWLAGRRRCRRGSGTHEAVAAPAKSVRASRAYRVRDMGRYERAARRRGYVCVLSSASTGRWESMAVRRVRPIRLRGCQRFRIRQDSVH